jgi:hypothetical protein
MFNQININGITLDLDSTVMTRYGTQESAARGYNPAKSGRAIHTCSWLSAQIPV